ncbi:MAG: TAXI family TRAP transporter solute-binding subunit [Candidatus Rariloculaceae bacterium]
MAIQDRARNSSATLAVLAMLAFISGCGSKDQTFVRVASGPAGGSWYPLGAKQAEVFTRSIAGVSASSGPGGGVGNIRDVSSGQAEVGFTYGHSAYDAYNGAEPFTEAHTNIRHLASLYPAAYHAAVPAASDLRSYYDLADSNLSPGKLTDSGYAIFQTIMSRYNQSPESVRANGGTVHHVSYSDSVALMKDGHIDALFAITSLPQAFFLDLEFRPGIRFLPVEDSILNQIIAQNTGYVRVQITGEHYDSVQEPVLTLGAVTTLVVNEHLPDELGYSLAKALWESHSDFVAVTDTWEQTGVSTALLGAGIPVHAGAMRYYEEQGVMAIGN